MTRRELIPVTSYDQVPDDMTEAEAREFWDTHEFTEAYLASAPPVPEDALPPIGPPRKYQAVYLKREVFQKVRRLARQRGVTIDELIDDLAADALAAEEKRIRGTGPRTASDAGRGRYPCPAVWYSQVGISLRIVIRLSLLGGS